jgi:hypothetical protein
MCTVKEKQKRVASAKQMNRLGKSVLQLRNPRNQQEKMAKFIAINNAINSILGAEMVLLLLLGPGNT